MTLFAIDRGCMYCQAISALFASEASTPRLGLAVVARSACGPPTFNKARQSREATALAFFAARSRSDFTAGGSLTRNGRNTTHGIKTLPTIKFSSNALRTTGSIGGGGSSGRRSKHLPNIRGHGNGAEGNPSTSSTTPALLMMSTGFRAVRSRGRAFWGVVSSGGPTTRRRP